MYRERAFVGMHRGTKRGEARRSGQENTAATTTWSLLQEVLLVFGASKYRLLAQVPTQLSVGTYEYIGTAQHSPRSQLYQSVESSTILYSNLGGFQQRWPTRMLHLSSINRSIARVLQLLVLLIVPSIDCLVPDLPLRSRPLHTKQVPRRCLMLSALFISSSVQAKTVLI